MASAGDGDKPALIHSLQKDAAQPEDSGDRRVARRAIGSISIESMERGRELMGNRDYAAAARLYETAVLLRPENADAWYSLSVAQAAAGNTRRALEALEQAAGHGFRDAPRIEQEPLFTRLHRDARYQAVLQKLR